MNVLVLVCREGSSLETMGHDKCRRSKTETTFWFGRVAGDFRRRKQDARTAKTCFFVRLYANMNATLQGQQL
ncbi:hypothetical protein NC653_009324 [Populus alba x Populus x berolinensis]|uniref:Uncharacterized protein n=1 Tax=Populus alba x Populus x berolinensis TaxID=444605 RepID=A0AAD6R8M7_9ROSI|nr:hypothetical protein NC653_009324 [Populus alba x Populus x berolinensis]